MITNKLRLKFYSLIILASLVAVFLFARNDTAYAAPVTGFTPGYIISDNIFTNPQSMTVDQIQQFLNSKVSSCDTTGSLRATEYGSNLTHAQYAASKGWSAPPYTCLKDYSQNGLSSAQLIYNTAQTYQINPQVLIVLLQKEQGLVTDTWPLATQYKSATGYGCPDTSACDSTYYGFTNQVVWSAKMFHAIMVASPTWYTPYITGNNYIQYNPNASCGGTTVNILNRATQALYNYTPYQPNQSALNAGYGMGDSCGAYGNRNFYQYFSDWFGSPQYGNLVRTVDNATVYLISGTNKYPIADINVLIALSSLGGVSYANQTYIDSLTTAPVMGRVVRSNSGTVYFYDSGIKLPFSSCTQVSDYGSSCGQAVLLEDGQINLLSSGTGMTSLYRTTSGKIFYITNGTKREVYDTGSLSAAGISDAQNVLGESGLNNLAYGAPVIRSNVIVTNRDNGQKYLYSNNTYYSLPAVHASYSYVQSLPTGTLDDSSIPIGQISSAFNGFVTDAITGNKYILMPQGKVQLTDPSMWGATATMIDGSLITSLPTSTDPINNGLVMTPGNGTVYYVTGGTKRPVPGWTDLVDLKVQPFVINTIDSAEMSAIPNGPLVYPPGHMVKTANSATVYIVKSYTELLPISSFTFPQELGSPMILETISDTDFSTYTVDGAVQSQIVCSGQDYVGINGILYPMSGSDLTKFGLVQSSFVDAGLLCGVLSKSAQPLPSFLLDSTGTIYLMQSGTKRAFTGYGAYLANGGTPQNTLKVSSYFTSLIPNGINITQ